MHTYIYNAHTKYGLSAKNNYTYQTTANSLIFKSNAIFKVQQYNMEISVLILAPLIKAKLKYSVTINYRKK